MTARHSAIAAIASHKVASSQKFLELAGEDIYGLYVFLEVGKLLYLAAPI